MRSRIVLLILSTNLVACAAGELIALHFSHRDEVLTPALIEYDRIGSVGSQEISALSGSMVSSQALAEKFGDCAARKIAGGDPKAVRPETLDCINKMRFWEQIDRENGGSYGISILHGNLVGKGSCASLARAKFWGKVMRDRYGELPRSWSESEDEFSRRCH
jgi:hypothetical protein